LIVVDTHIIIWDALKPDQISKKAKKATTLPNEINKDPADRIISATSVIKKAPLITADKNLQKAKSIKTIW